MRGWITSATECLINISFYIFNFTFGQLQWLGKREDYEPRKALKARKEYNEIEKMRRWEDEKRGWGEEGMGGRGDGEKMGRGEAIEGFCY
jgi:hypothetical protein